MLARLVLGATGLGRVATTGAARWATGARFSPRVLTKECPNAGQTVDYKVRAHMPTPPFSSSSPFPPPLLPLALALYGTMTHHMTPAR